MQLAAQPTLDFHTLFEKLLGTVNSAVSESGGLDLRLLLNNSRTSSLVYAGTNHLDRLQTTINVCCNHSTAGNRSSGWSCAASQADISLSKQWCTITCIHHSGLTVAMNSAWQDKYYIAAFTPFAKYFKEVLLRSSVKLPRPCRIAPLFIHFDGCHVSCNHAAVHDQKANYRQCKGCINDKCQEQHCRPALQRTKGGAKQMLPDKVQMNACLRWILAASVSPCNHCTNDRFTWHAPGWVMQIHDDEQERIAQVQPVMSSKNSTGLT